MGNVFIDLGIITHVVFNYNVYWPTLARKNHDSLNSYVLHLFDVQTTKNNNNHKNILHFRLYLILKKSSRRLYSSHCFILFFCFYVLCGKFERLIERIKNCSVHLIFGNTAKKNFRNLKKYVQFVQSHVLQNEAAGLVLYILSIDLPDFLFQKLQTIKLNIRKLFIKTLVSTTLNFFKDFNSNVIRRFQQHKTSGYPISRLIENLFKFILNFYFALMFIFKLPALAYTPHTQYISKSFLFSQSAFQIQSILCRNVHISILN